MSDTRAHLPASCVLDQANSATQVLSPLFVLGCWTAPSIGLIALIPYLPFVVMAAGAAHVLHGFFQARNKRSGDWLWRSADERRGCLVIGSNSRDNDESQASGRGANSEKFMSLNGTDHGWQGVIPERDRSGVSTSSNGSKQCNNRRARAGSSERSKYRAGNSEREDDGENSVLEEQRGQRGLHAFSRHST